MHAYMPSRPDSMKSNVCCLRSLLFSSDRVGSEKLSGLTLLFLQVIIIGATLQLVSLS